MQYLIESLEFQEGRRLRLLYSEGGSLTKDFQPLIAEGGQFARLADESYWRQAQVIDAGHALGWPAIGEDPITALDFCADALWFEAHPEDYGRFLDQLDPAR